MGVRVLVAHPSADLYGSDRVLLETVTGVIESGAAVVVCLPFDGPLVGELRARGARVEFCRAPVIRKSALRPAGAVRLLADVIRGAPAALRVLHRVDPDLVLVNTVTIPLWLILARLTRRRVVCHVHEAEQSVPAPVRRALSAPLLLAHRLVVNSWFSLGVLESSFPSLRSKASVVYNGVPGPARPPAPRPVLTDAVRLVYVGRLSPRKGPDVAIEAVSALVGRGTRARLDLVGSTFPGYEWFSEQLRRTVDDDERLCGLVTFHGFATDVWQHLAAADIVLVPSIQDEPFGNTAVEAVLAVRPAIVSATSGLLEAASGYASVVAVAPGEAIAIADAVQGVVADWPHFARTAISDADTARERHAPGRYRAEVARIVISASRTAAWTSVSGTEQVRDRAR